MNRSILGLHHVTAIAGDPQRNVDFYTRLLGMRLVKLTVNYDDPGTYHLYFGDESGHPGTVLTFFPWEKGARGRRGTGQVTATSFSVPQGSMGYWIDRFKNHGVMFEDPLKRFDDEVLPFYDPDGLLLELVESSKPDDRTPWDGGPVAVEHGIRGFYGITMSEEGYERTASLLTQTMGFKLTGEHVNLYRYEIGEGGPGRTVDVLCVPAGDSGWVAVGTVHHVAFRTPDDEQQKSWRQELVDQDYNVTPVIDRNYFHSIYFREPGHVLFEIATDPPGFTKDESLDRLGTGLMLPPWLERVRMQIEASLPKLRLPEQKLRMAA